MTGILYHLGVSIPNFNSHAHVERDKILDLLSCVQPYFNSHAHVERDENRLSTPFDANISTHTLTWSVTVKFSSAIISPP